VTALAVTPAKPLDLAAVWKTLVVQLAATAAALVQPAALKMLVALVLAAASKMLAALVLAAASKMPAVLVRAAA